MATVRVLGALAAALVFAQPVVAAPPRVMSLDSCADQYVLALAPRDTIVGLSHRAGASDSYMRMASVGLPRRRATFESLVVARPQVVVRHWGGDARLVSALDRTGVVTVKIEDAADFAAVRANVRRVAEALDQKATGEAIIARMDGQLRAAAGVWRGETALYLTPGGYTAGSGTLIDAMLKASGLSNASTRPYFSAMPLERLVMAPPQTVVKGFFDLTRAGSDRWGPGRHAALTRATADRTIASLPGAIVGCPAWFAAEGVTRLARGRTAR